MLCLCLVLALWNAKRVIYGERANVIYGGLIHPQLKLKESSARARTGKQKFPLQPLSQQP